MKRGEKGTLCGGKRKKKRKDYGNEDFLFLSFRVYVATEDIAYKVLKIIPAL